MDLPVLSGRDGRAGIVRLAWYRYDPERVRLMHRRTCHCDWFVRTQAWWTKQTAPTGRVIDYVHVEAMFPDETVTSVSEDGGGVHYDKNRLLSNDGYEEMIELHLTPDQAGKMQEYAYNAWKNKVGFNKAAMTWNFLPVVGYLFPYRRGGTHVTCSELMVRMLQHAGLCMNLDPDRTSPPALYIELMHGRDQLASPSFNKKLQAHRIQNGNIAPTDVMLREVLRI